MFFVILVDDVYCVAIHDLSPVLTALFPLNLGDLTVNTELLRSQVVSLRAVTERVFIMTIMFWFGVSC